MAKLPAQPTDPTMTHRIQTHAREKLVFPADDTPARRLAACKRFLRLEGQMILMRHRAGEPGLKVAQARSALIDVLLSHLVEPVLAPYAGRDDDPGVALVALGGYGRGELCPLSDVDIMFLHPSGLKEPVLKQVQQSLTDRVLYILWDLGLKVGQSFRSADEAFAEARADMATKTSLLEARFIAGNEKTFRTFEKAFRAFYLKENPKGYIEARLADQAERRAKQGDTVYLQEPDIKNGVGGLRDHQNALWMARVKLGVHTLDELVPAGYLHAGELRDFRRAYNFLLRVRNQLHFESRKATDVLHLEKQPRVARHLGYMQRDPLKRVEEFMRDYYRNAQAIYRTSKILEHRLALSPGREESGRVSFAEVLRARRHERTKRLDGFIMRGRELSAEHDGVFKEDPARLVRVFRHSQQLNVSLDFDLQALVRASVPLMRRATIESPETNRAFRAILEDAGKVHPTLAVMHELGVLGRFIPEWDALTCLVQHEYYHRYTADVHTLHTIRELDRVLTSPETRYAPYRRQLREATLPHILYPVLLLHDIGKGEAIEDHSESGVRIADPILRRLGYDEPHREIMRFLIKNHLTMARFWQKHDLDDPHTIEAFADIVGDAERLRLLYVHTFCDAQATASGLWNSYKETLHTTLFRNAAGHLDHGASAEHQAAERFAMTKQDLLSRTIPDVGEDEINAHFSLLPERYFIQTDNDEIALHLQMVNRLFKTIITTDNVSALEPTLDWRDDISRSLTVVNIVTWDRAGLFYKLAGAFSLAGLNILSAKVISRADHIAIDTFHVVEPGRGVVQSAKVMDAFQKCVHAALIQNRDLLPEIQVQAQKNQARLLTSDQNPLLASFTPRVDVYHELTLKRTIVEVQSPDQIGLLFRIAKAIYDHGFDITFARINTERGLAIDTFYIENANKEEMTIEPERLAALRETLNGIILVGQRAAVDF